ncbi:hypothetical protein LI951_09475 [Enterococcus sp. BWT-B8]|uniref:hypothetical protein n=1 Tax=unclassified Enterococcus TaxID=2608891 RepID=UPI001E29176B|nr:MULTISPECIES: hypothetical protein [unclassified Enterococcus]MCB5952293.1 hypothetical protein [Enterococcus sp. BWT-B8]MCB5955478.1 hypothetical protein [Enterococcus sp. CWB-B31]
MNINMQDHQQRTALHNYAGYGVKNLEALINAGADVDALDYQGETLLFSTTNHVEYPILLKSGLLKEQQEICS